MDYSVIVFDTSLTSQTLGLLQFPSNLEKDLSIQDYGLVE